MSTVRAVALVGFYKGDLVRPGDVLDLSVAEFQELVAMQKVARAPELPPAEASPKKDAAKK